MSYIDISHNAPAQAAIIARSRKVINEAGVYEGLLVEAGATSGYLKITAGTLFTRDGIRIYEPSDLDDEVQMSNADGSLPRIDLVVLEYEFAATVPAPQHGFAIIEGTPGADPAFPATTAAQYILGVLFRAPGSGVSLADPSFIVAGFSEARYRNDHIKVVGNGTTVIGDFNGANQIQAAIDAIAGGGGEVWLIANALGSAFGDGLKKTINLRDGIELKGFGWPKIVGDVAGPIFKAAGIENFGVAGLEFAPAAGQYAIDIQASQHGRLRNLKVLTGRGIQAGTTQICTDIEAEDVNVYACGALGLNVANITRGRFRRFTFSSTGFVAGTGLVNVRIEEPIATDQEPGAAGDEDETFNPYPLPGLCEDFVAANNGGLTSGVVRCSGRFKVNAGVTISVAPPATGSTGPLYVNRAAIAGVDAGGGGGCGSAASGGQGGAQGGAGAHDNEGQLNLGARSLAWGLLPGCLSALAGGGEDGKAGDSGTTGGMAGMAGTGGGALVVIADGPVEIDGALAAVGTNGSNGSAATVTTSANTGGSGGSGGGGGALVLISRTAIAFGAAAELRVYGGGGGGGGGAASTDGTSNGGGGGGGGGGGLVILVAPRVGNAGVIVKNGGGGGSGGVAAGVSSNNNGVDGGDGGDGQVITIVADPARLGF